MWGQLTFNNWILIGFTIFSFSHVPSLLTTFTLCPCDVDRSPTLNMWEPSVSWAIFALHSSCSSRLSFDLAFIIFYYKESAGWGGKLASSQGRKVASVTARSHWRGGGRRFSFFMMYGCQSNIMKGLQIGTQKWLSNLWNYMMKGLQIGTQKFIPVQHPNPQSLCRLVRRLQQPDKTFFWQLHWQPWFTPDWSVYDITISPGLSRVAGSVKTLIVRVPSSVFRLPCSVRNCCNGHSLKNANKKISKT